MPPEEENKETQTAQQTQATQGTQGTQETQATLETALTERDALIAALQSQLSEAKQATESLRAEGVAISAAHSKAVSKYLDAVKLANPTIPGDVIAGSTIDEVDASVARAKAIADSVKKVLEAQARETKVPAGAPARGEISLEGLSPREKIAAGIQQKGGTP